jgi:GT2 family glycosyltransferase
VSGPISAIIPTVGRPDKLRACLDSIARQSQPVAEVLVVHCGDDAETADVVGDPRWAAAGIRCHYFAYPERHAAAQRNFAIQRAAHDNLLLLDDDVELEPGWVAALFEPIWADPAVGATMGRLVNQPIARPTTWWRIYRHLVAGSAGLAPGRLIGAAMPNGFPVSAVQPMPTEWIGGGVSAIRRRAFVSVGGFAPYFNGSSPGEDLDLGFRLSRHWKVLYVPAARCVHHEDRRGRGRDEDYQYQSIRSRYAIRLRAFGSSRAAALAHVMIWLVFQAVSELAAVRHGRLRGLGKVWTARLRAVKSCVRWIPPPAGGDRSLMPAHAR